MDDELAFLLTLGRRRVDRVGTAYVRDVVADLSPDQRLQIILGARGVGKTTALRQFARSTLGETRYAYLDLDDLYFAEHRLVRVVDDLYDAGYRYLLLDEAHRYTDWSGEVKAAYDRYDDLRIVLTGSSVSALVQGDADLSRRARWYKLRGMSLREYAAVAHAVSLPQVTLDDVLGSAEELSAEVERALTQKHLASVPLLDEYLASGYYPYVFEDREGYHARLRKTAHTAIDIDVVPAANLNAESVHKLKRLLELLAGNVPYRPNVSHVERQLGADRKQVYRLLDLLERAVLIRRLWVSGASPTTLRKPEKIYLDNPNLAYALNSVNVGNLRETAFLAMTDPAGTAHASREADFELEGHTFEIGGKGKSRRQLPAGGYRVIANVAAPYAPDVLPLHLFGLLA